MIRKMAERACLLLLLIGFAACSTGNASSTNDLKITLNTIPERLSVGTGQLVVDVLDAKGQPLEGADVELSVGMSGMAMNTQDGPAIEQSKGRYIGAAMFHTKGSYTLRVFVNRAGQTLKTQDFPLTVA